MESIERCILRCLYSLLLIVGHVKCYQTGAQTDSCTSLGIDHKEDTTNNRIPSSSQPSLYSINIITNDFLYRVQREVTVRIESTSAAVPFKGFIIQARTEGTVLPVGEWINLPMHTKTIECIANKDTATHSSGQFITNVLELKWIPSDDYGTVRFWSSVAQDYSLFWTILTSQTLAYDNRPIFYLNPINTIVTEGDNTAYIDVCVNKAISPVEVELRGITGTAGVSDVFISPQGTFIQLPVTSNKLCFPIFQTIINDALEELSEEFYFTIARVGGNALIDVPYSTATVTILDNNGGTTENEILIRFPNSRQYNAVEGDDAVQIEVCASTLPQQDIFIEWSVIRSSASSGPVNEDIQYTSPTTISANQLCNSLNINITEDNIVEMTETFIIELISTQPVGTIVQNAKMSYLTVSDAVRVDTTSPIVNCISNVTETISLGDTTTVVFWIEPTAEDDSNIVNLLSRSHVPGSSFSIGSTEVRYIFVDGSNNKANCTFFVIVAAEDACRTSLCQNGGICVDKRSGGEFFCICIAGFDGDMCQNTVDTTSVNCNSNVTKTVSLGDTTIVVSWIEPTVEDDSFTLLTRSHAPGSSFSIGLTEVSYVFVDSSNNKANCTFFVIIIAPVDTTAPVVNCISSVTETETLGTDGTVVSWIEPTAEDDSANVGLLSRSHVPGSLFSIGSTEVTYVFADPSGNEANCTFFVIIIAADTCGSSPCHNEGTCTDVENGGFFCLCVDGFHGNRCQITESFLPITISPTMVTIIEGNSDILEICYLTMLNSILTVDVRVSFQTASATDIAGNITTGNLSYTLDEDRRCISLEVTAVDDTEEEEDEILVVSIMDVSGVDSRRLDASETTATVTIVEKGPVCELEMPCQNGGICIDNPGRTFTCDCPTEWVGQTCSYANPCLSSNPCFNNGTCEVIIDFIGVNSTMPTTRCNCSTLWNGNSCEEAVLCSHDPCKNGAVCIGVMAGMDYECTNCPADYTGKDCDIFLPCSSSPCQNGGSCTNVGQIDFQCECTSEFAGNDCSQDNPCLQEPTPCMNGANCATTRDGLVQCHCTDHFFGRFCGTPAVCISNPCQNRGSCSFDGANSYTCQCVTGFLGDTCNLNDFCSNDPCLNGGTCSNTETRFSCRCPNNFIGGICDIRLIPTHLCYTSTPCLNGGTCEVRNGGLYNCLCPPFTKGPNCSEIIPVVVDCETDAASFCLNGSTCRFNMQTMDISCICPPGFTGPQCDIPVVTVPDHVNPCHSQPCKNGGNCFNVTQISFVCTCIDSMFSGTLCEKCARNLCQNGGLCMRTGECQCPTGTSGDACELFDVCRDFVCENGGICQIQSQQPTCSCSDGYIGPNCMQEDPCFPVQCLNGGFCIGQQGQCTCPSGFEGTYCQVESVPLKGGALRGHQDICFVLITFTITAVHFVIFVA